MAYHHRDTDKLLVEAVVFVRSKGRITIPKKFFEVENKSFGYNFWLQMLMNGSYYAWTKKHKDRRVTVPFAVGTKLMLELYEDYSRFDRAIEVHKLGPYSN